MGLVHTSVAEEGPRPRRALALAALLAALALSLGASSATAAGCPSFRVLHDDRIGPAVLPAGNYKVTVATVVGPHLPRRLETLHPLPRGLRRRPARAWRVIAQGSGKASFTRGGKAGFSVAPAPAAAKAAATTNSAPSARTPSRSTPTSSLGPLTFAKGQYLLYLPPRSGISCNRAAVLFTRFLGSPGGRLPFPWRLENQTATFFKPEHPARSAFRVEPAAGANAGAGPA